MRACSGLIRGSRLIPPGVVPYFSTTFRLADLFMQPS